MNANKAKTSRSDKEQAADKEPGVTLSPEDRRLRRRLIVVGLNLLTAGLLTASFAPFDCWFLAYVALVPWGVSLSGRACPRWTLIWAVLAGTVFWLVNVYWLIPITMAGYVPMVLYLSVYWLAAAAVMRPAMRRGWPAWIVLPVVWIALEYVRAYVISGFPWFYLAQSQYARPMLIQIVDATGEFGVSFFVAMVNGLVIDVCVRWSAKDRHGPVMTRQGITGVAACAGVLAGLLIYGGWRLGQDAQRPGPILGVVQEAYPIALGLNSRKSEDVLTAHLELAKRFEPARPDAVILPETMLPRFLNRQILDMDVSAMDSDRLRGLAVRIGATDEGKYTPDQLRSGLGKWVIEQRQIAKRVGDASGALGCPILAGCPSLHPNARALDRNDLWVVRNSALWFEGPLPDASDYSKMHLVPLSEYVPFKYSCHWLYEILRMPVPAAMEQLEPGESLTTFTLKRAGETWTIAAPICYEGTFARVCRSLVYQGGMKRVDIMANISNDGWFVMRHDGGWSDFLVDALVNASDHKWLDRAGDTWVATTEQPQHMVQYVFRAIENRVPVVRAVNTGVSASIDSNGRIVAQLRDEQGRRAMISGAMLLGGTAPAGVQGGPQVLVDSRSTLYSVVGDLFAMLVTASAAGIVGLLIYGRRRQKTLFPSEGKGT